MTDWRLLNDMILTLTQLLLIGELVTLVYLNSINGAFVFDDTSIVERVYPQILKRERE